MEYVDTLIIGAGYAGLYAAHLIRKKHGPHHRIIIIERDSRIGGRASTIDFGGTTVVTGAGIGRWDKDDCLKELMRDMSEPTLQDDAGGLREPCDARVAFGASKFCGAEPLMEVPSRQAHVGLAPPTDCAHMRAEGQQSCPHQRLNRRFLTFPIETFIHNPAYAFEPIDAEKTFKQLTRVANARTTKGKTFREFAMAHLGAEDYRRFVQSTGYSDFEKEDAMSTLKLYGMDDNFCCQDAKLFRVPWKQLAERIVEKDRIDVRLDCEAVSIKLPYHLASKGTLVSPRSEADRQPLVKTKRGPTYVCGRVIVATTISGLRKLFPHNPVYKHIQSQPFIRVYGKFSADTKHIMAAYVKKYTVVNTVLQKIIPMDVAKGVYMIAYSDNKSAVVLNKINSKDTFCRLLEKSLGIPGDSLCLIDMKKCYWHEGTHYVKPLRNLEERIRLIDEAQHPMSNVYAVGEAVCHDQGWVEGALKSVKNIYSEL